MSTFWTAVLFFGGALLITALGYSFNPYYEGHIEPASWSSGIYSD